MTVTKVLVIDDDTGLLTLMKTRLLAAGYEVSLAVSGDEAIRLVEQETFQVAILDLKLDGMDGIVVMQKLLQIQPSLPVIILTAHASFSGAVEATKKGAYDYLTKPFEAKALLHSIEKALEVGQLKDEVNRLRLLIKDRYNFDNIVASSQKNTICARSSRPSCRDRLDHLPVRRERNREGVDSQNSPSCRLTLEFRGHQLWGDP